ncbi:hypothetical protein GN958_ATG21255 [Phytophthora infestans]|uniref:Uncharacterized protein n=1 Tax=Phytophthora infestans TaxID=4787 RepID=A0A8S9TUB1_PHYIN|nr:hypothetical protein GN958_ATG21255 [Phytophthora infestans]
MPCGDSESIGPSGTLNVLRGARRAASVVCVVGCRLPIPAILDSKFVTVLIIRLSAVSSAASPLLPVAASAAYPCRGSLLALRVVSAFVVAVAVSRLVEALVDGFCVVVVLDAPDARLDRVVIPPGAAVFFCFSPSLLFV